MPRRWSAGEEDKGEIDPPNRLAPDMSQRVNDAIVAGPESGPRPVDRPAACLEFVKLLTTRRVPPRTAGGTLPGDRAPGATAGPPSGTRSPWRPGAHRHRGRRRRGRHDRDWPAVGAGHLVRRAGAGAGPAVRAGDELTVGTSLRAARRPAEERAGEGGDVRPEMRWSWRHGCSLADPLAGRGAAADAVTNHTTTRGSCRDHPRVRQINQDLRFPHRLA